MAEVMADSGAGVPGGHVRLAAATAHVVAAWRAVYIARSGWEASLALGWLEAAGVPARIANEHLARVGIMCDGFEVQVPQVHSAAALQALRKVPGARGVLPHREVGELRHAIAGGGTGRTAEGASRWPLVAAVVAGALALMALIAAFAGSETPARTGRAVDGPARGGLASSPR